MDDCEEADIEVLLDGRGSSQLSRVGNSQGGSLMVNDNDGSIRRVDLPRYGLFLDGNLLGNDSAFDVDPSRQAY